MVFLRNAIVWQCWVKRVRETATDLNKEFLCSSLSKEFGFLWGELQKSQMCLAFHKELHRDVPFLGVHWWQQGNGRIPTRKFMKTWSQ